MFQSEEEEQEEEEEEQEEGWEATLNSEIDEKQRYGRNTAPDGPSGGREGQRVRSVSDRRTDRRTDVHGLPPPELRQTDGRTRSTSSGSQTAGRPCRTRWEGPRFCGGRTTDQKHGDIHFISQPFCFP